MSVTANGERTPPVSAADLAGKRLRLGEGFICEDQAWWVQSDPTAGGRTTLVTRDSSGGLVDLTPDWDLRTSVHEYGGTAVAVQTSQEHPLWTGTACFFDRRTGLVWVRRPNGETRPVTPEGPWAYGGFQFLGGHHAVCVREDHSPDLSEPQDTIVLLDLSSKNPEGGRIVARGADFYFSPTASATGWIAWMEYDHPSMPWGSTRIMALAPDGTLHTVADAQDVSAVHPQWDRDGSLYFLADDDGYWNFHRWADGETTRLHDDPHDFCIPQWVLSPPPYALLPGKDGTRVGCSWWQDGFCHLGIFESDSTLTELGVYGSLSLAPATSGRSVIGLGTPTAPASLAVLDWGTGKLTSLAQESTLEIPPEAVSVPELVRWQASDSLDDVTGWHYPPTPTVDTPPLLVLSHGGPTSFSPAVFSLVTQYFTSRGIAVLDVNYSGSSTMGRAYRERLDGKWGILDVRDCVDGAQHLARLGLADPARMAIMGGSAGGFTALASLTTTDAFSAGVSMYGVADLEGLARDTSKFESHYTDSLVAPYPEGLQIYRERSPIHHVDRLSCPLLILQGGQDMVVPPSQATAMYDAVRAKGLEAELVLYEDEGHGFRQASTIEDAYTRVLSFLSRVWGLAHP